jgi:hypothetical protein
MDTILDEPNRLSLLLSKWCLDEYPELRGKVMILNSHPTGKYMGNEYYLCVEIRPYDQWDRATFAALFDLTKPEDRIKSQYILIETEVVRGLAGTPALQKYFMQQLKPALDEIREILSVYAIMRS